MNMVPVGRQDLTGVLDWIYEHDQVRKDFEAKFPFLAYAYLNGGNLEAVNGVIRLKDTGLGEYLKVEQSQDPDYPGVDIEFASRVVDGTDAAVTYPRVCVEQNKDSGQVRVLIWDDPLNEDYTREILLTDSFVQYIQQSGLGRA